MDEQAPAVEIRGLSKAFGATVALDDVSLAIPRGEVHALLGENGAGKSTLVKILSGLSRQDTGEVALFGDAARIDTPRDSHRLGIQTAHQEISLIGDLTVVQSMLLPYEPTGPTGHIRRRESEREVRRALAGLGLDDIDPHAEVRTLALPTRQKIEIARAVSRKPRLLLLDEPTSSLSGNDVQWLGALFARLRAEGTTIVFISHRMQEVRDFCDSLTILRNGRMVGGFRADEISDDRVIELVIGRSLTATFPPKPAEPARRGEAPILAAEGLAIEGGMEDFSFSLWPGEILGVGGLDGMGQRDLFLALFGMVGISAGDILIGGNRVTLRSPKDAVNSRIGISFVPEDRKTEALFLALTGRENISLPIIDSLRAFRSGGPAAGIAGRGPGARHGPGRQARAPQPLQRLQRRQPAEDRHRQVATRREPRAAHVRPDAGRRRRYQGGDLRPHAGVRGGRRGGALLLDRRAGAREPL